MGRVPSLILLRPRSAFTISHAFLLLLLVCCWSSHRSISAEAFSSVLRMSSNVPGRLKELGITLKEPPSPKGNYVSCVRTGNLLHVCGHIPQKEDGSLHTGKLGKDLTVEQGYQSARACAINIFATLQQQLNGDWSKIRKIVKVVGFVQSADDFHQQPAVINGASDLFVEVLGKDIGQHARSAVGTNALPLNIATEVECIVELED